MHQPNANCGKYFSYYCLGSQLKEMKEGQLQFTTKWASTEWEAIQGVPVWWQHLNRKTNHYKSVSLGMLSFILNLWIPSFLPPRWSPKASLGNAAVSCNKDTVSAAAQRCPAGRNSWALKETWQCGLIKLIRGFWHMEGNCLELMQDAEAAVTA